MAAAPELPQSMVLLMNLVEPSAIPATTPPGWWLLGGTSSQVPSAAEFEQAGELGGDTVVKAPYTGAPSYIRRPRP